MGMNVKVLNLVTMQVNIESVWFVFPLYCFPKIYKYEPTNKIFLN